MITAPEPQKDLLSIDFMYTKIYIYSLALQAVAERKISYKFTEGVANEFISSILDLNYGDYEFIREVIDSAKAVLGTIHSFAGTGRLKFLPVRIYVRVISACIFLLKVNTLFVYPSLSSPYTQPCDVCHISVGEPTREKTIAHTMIRLWP